MQPNDAVQVIRDWRIIGGGIDANGYYTTFERVVLRNGKRVVEQMDVPAQPVQHGSERRATSDGAGE